MAHLKKVAIVGAVVALGGAGYFQWRIQANFRQQPFYVESIRLLQGYPPAVRLLGEPIRMKNLDLGDTEKTWSDGLNARLAIPVKGSLMKATLHSWASRKTVKDRWSVDKLDLEMKDRSWTFYVNPKAKTTEQSRSEFSTDVTQEQEENGQLSYINTNFK